MGDNLAILIDADNISSKHVTALMAEVANYGTASVRRIYGDWTSPSMKSWREVLLEHSIVPMQQFAYTNGKNATDGAMIIDAMDLLYTGRFSSFCIVSNDSDFTRLAARIREQGLSVYGFGNRHNTHKAFIAACTEFVYLDALSSSQPDETVPGSVPVAGTEAPSASTTTAATHTAATVPATPAATTSPAPLTATPPPRPSSQPPASLWDRPFTPASTGTATNSGGLPLPYSPKPLTPPTAPRATQPMLTGIQWPPIATKSPALSSPVRTSQEPPSRPSQEPPSGHAPKPEPRPLDQAAMTAIRTAIAMSPIYEDDYVNLAEVGMYLLRLSPDLNHRNYGYTRLREFLNASGIVELKTKERPPAPPIAMAKLKGR